MFFYHNRRRQNNYGVYLLAYQLFNSRNIPPVTLIVIIFQMAVFLGYFPALGLHKTEAMCLLPSRILYRSEWLRMFASTVIHADDMHLYFNMISLLWKGRRLEPLLGSNYFLLLLMVFALATSSTMVGLSYLADEVFALDGDFMHQCAVGFSGVLFALKVLHTTYFPYSDHYLFGWLPIPSQFACWAELFLLQMLTPNASFIGHLSGVIVGLAYTMGPLKTVVNILENIISLLFGIMPQSSSQTRSRTWSNNRNWFTNWSFGGRDGATHETPPHYGWRNEQRRFDEYTAGMSEEEQMWRATQRSLYEEG